MSKTHYAHLKEEKCYYCHEEKADPTVTYSAILGYRMSEELIFYHDEVTVCDDCLRLFEESNENYKEQAKKEFEDFSLGIIY